MDKTEATRIRTSIVMTPARSGLYLGIAVVDRSIMQMTSR